MELKNIKIKKVEFLKDFDTVYDINVKDVHHYILKNGVVTHNTMEIYSKTVLSGGCMNPDAKVKMADGSIKEIQNIIKGDFVETLQGSKEVLEKVQFDNKALYEIVLANGSKYICSSDHRFLTSEDWTNEENWKYVDELEENDDILMVF